MDFARRGAEQMRRRLCSKVDEWERLGIAAGDPGRGGTRHAEGWVNGADAAEVGVDPRLQVLIARSRDQLEKPPGAGWLCASSLALPQLSCSRPASCESGRRQTTAPVPRPATRWRIGRRSQQSGDISAEALAEALRGFN